MTIKNKIFIIGNGFDIAHQLRTKFSDFAEHYIDNVIIPKLIDCVINRRNDPLFRDHFLNLIIPNFTNYGQHKPEDILRSFASIKDKLSLKKYITENYTVLQSLLENSLLVKLYCSGATNWFDIENTYFNELIPIKDRAIKTPKTFDPKDLKKLNSDFQEIKESLINYLNTLHIDKNEEIEMFLNSYLSDAHSGYVINFNYTSTVKSYIIDSERFKINHIHGNLKEDNIIFGYGNDQNDHYQEMKNSGIEDFLHFFKTFDYLQDINYDKIYEEALNKYDEYEVYIIGHSLGMTDKTLISEILNSEKCKKINLFKRGDLKVDPQKVKHDFRNLNYAASRILTDEIQLRKKLVNFKNSTFFPN